ncbi:YlbG family protein [Macrococcoides canis]
MMMSIVERTQLIIYIKSPKHERQLRKFGHIVHINRSEKWLSMYVNSDKLEWTLEQLEKLKFVTNVINSSYKSLKKDYSSSSAE